MEAYFNNLLPGGKVYRPRGVVICMKRIPDNAMQLYMTGFEHLSLKPKGVELLEQLCENDLNFLLEVRKNPEDLKMIRQVLKGKKSVKSATKTKDKNAKM